MFFNYFHGSTVPGAALPRQIPIQHDFVERPILTMFSWRVLWVPPVPARKPCTNVLDNASLAARVPNATLLSQMAQKCHDESIIRQHVFLTRSSPGTRLQNFVPPMSLVSGDNCGVITGDASPRQIPSTTSSTWERNPTDSN